ncbi:MAG: GAF domain-containing protein [Opitutales bacterium]
MPAPFTAEPPAQAWLETFLAREGGIAGTVHRRQGDQLFLIAAVRIPPPVLQITAVIPSGKGMAGLALERRQPVQTCNLQTDQTGVVRPGARAVNAQAAVALPVFDSSGEIRAVVGIAYDHEQELPPEKIRALSAAAASVPA